MQMGGVNLNFIGNGIRIGWLQKVIFFKKLIYSFLRKGQKKGYKNFMRVLERVVNAGILKWEKILANIFFDEIYYLIHPPGRSPVC